MLMMILSGVLSAGCSPQIPSDTCAGWQAIYMAPGTPAWLNTHDRPTLAAIVAHDEFGAQIGCWK